MCLSSQAFAGRPLCAAPEGAPKRVALLEGPTLPLCEVLKGPTTGSLSSGDPELGSKGQVLIRSGASRRGACRGWEDKTVTTYGAS